jgi:hypothetical protein
MKYIDWNQLSELGLQERINREILHPLGLAVMRNPEDGTSSGALIADDGVWEYSPELDTKIISDSEVKDKLNSMAGHNHD